MTKSLHFFYNAPRTHVGVQILFYSKEVISMKNLLKMTAIAALTFTSISTFAASQQAEEVKKFQAWEETASKKLEASFDAVGAASATSNATETEAAVAAFDKQAAENVAELEALGIKSEEVSPVVGKYKEFINAEKEVIHLILTQVKSPTAENATKIPELAAKMSDKGDELGKLVEQLEEKFPAE